MDDKRMLTGRLMLLGLAAIAAAIVAVLMLPGADAVVSPQGNCAAGATNMGNAIVDQAGLLTGATWIHYPGSVSGCPPASGCTFPTVPAATSDSTITTSFGAPTGTDFAILSSGSTACAPMPNTSGSTSGSMGDSYSGGNDVTVLKLDLSVPGGVTYLCVDLQFMSEEWPEYVGSFSDALIGELDTTSWSASGFTISAPANFALDGGGSMMFVGNPTMSAANAGGSTYDGATPKVTAKTPITGGPHSVYFSMFDTLDSIYDSTAFIDNLRVGVLDSSGNCIGAPAPVAEFSWIFTTTGTQLAPGYAGPYDLTYDPVQFTDLTYFPPWPGSTKSWTWDFGDGYADAMQNPEHTYVDNGVYNVCLTATLTTSMTQASSICHPLTVNNRPPSPTFTPSGAPFSQYLLFKDASVDMDGLVVSWHWDFGDGGTFDGHFPHHMFADAGTYTVCLTVVDDDGASNTYCREVNIELKDMPDADQDGLWDDADNCPSIANHDQADQDNDGNGDVCDLDYAPEGSEDAAPGAHTKMGTVDTDHDGLADDADNCPIDSNHDQADLDGDAQGDTCDPDVDGDTIPNVSADPNAILDNCPLDNNGDQADADADGLGDACDETPGLLAIGTKVKDADAARPAANADATPAATHEGLASFFADPARAALSIGVLAAIGILATLLAVWAIRRWKA